MSIYYVGGSPVLVTGDTAVKMSDLDLVLRQLMVDPHHSQLWVVGPQPSSKLLAKFIGESPSGWAQRPAYALWVPHCSAPLHPTISCSRPLVCSVPVAQKPCVWWGRRCHMQGRGPGQGASCTSQVSHAMAFLPHGPPVWREVHRLSRSPSACLLHLFEFISLSNVCYQSRKLSRIWKEIIVGYVCVYICAYVCICPCVYMHIYVCACVYKCMCYA